MTQRLFGWQREEAVVNSTEEGTRAIPEFMHQYVQHSEQAFRKQQPQIQLLWLMFGVNHLVVDWYNGRPLQKSISKTCLAHNSAGNHSVWMHSALREVDALLSAHAAAHPHTHYLSTLALEAQRGDEHRGESHSPWSGKYVDCLHWASCSDVLRTELVLLLHAVAEIQGGA
eukprot:NODE_1322_length_1378_cov_55.832134_g1310_i0.p2 GENE.NODE_1322_length_1378_cov_55.832134_g1310_i0~~NODE_1322_length_1378_cov_55.832134_g1310_i0.p2  ORF type:complete len:171 (+),score=27.92 NODE_1322_length_1378_cov_55.832134_g1310_i0:523-1035(+)